MQDRTGYYCSECHKRVDQEPERMAGLCFNCTILVWQKREVEDISDGGIFFRYKELNYNEIKSECR